MISFNGLLILNHNGDYSFNIEYIDILALRIQYWLPRIDNPSENLGLIIQSIISMFFQSIIIMEYLTVPWNIQVVLWRLAMAQRYQKSGWKGDEFIC